MTNSSKMVAAISAVVLVGCTAAQLVEARGDSPNAPSGEARGGRVKYELGGTMERQAREDAYRAMRDYCQGDYAITGEWDAAGDTLVVATTMGYPALAGQPIRPGGNVRGPVMGVNATSSVVSAHQAEFRLVDFACGRPAVAVVPDQRGSGLDAVSGDGTTPVVGSARKVIATMSADTGCPSERIRIESSMESVHRVDACGTTYVCETSGGAVACRLALVQARDGGPG